MVTTSWIQKVPTTFPFSLTMSNSQRTKVSGGQDGLVERTRHFVLCGRYSRSAAQTTVHLGKFRFSLLVASGCMQLSVVAK